jgi:signal recognition particle subunit SRP54
MFETLTERLQKTFKTLRGHGKLTDRNMRETLREVRLALLEADVNYKVAKQFVGAVEQAAIGNRVVDSVTPAQQLIKIVHDELVKVMGDDRSEIHTAPHPPTVLMLVGLHGSGKTTTAGKLAKMLHSKGHSPMLVAADVYRPAAIEQLRIVAEQVATAFFSRSDGVSPITICRQAAESARKEGHDICILDTAGRLHIDDQLMTELRNIKAALDPQEILFVADAMTGQDAVKAAATFHADLKLTGVILTKMDGDARGGAALSIRRTAGCPIKFVGVGEKLDALEPFHPDRMASRILGMGDVVTLVEKAQHAIDEKEAKRWEEKLRKQQFNLEDFVEQLDRLRSMGPIEDVVSMIPGMPQMKGIQPDERDLAKVEAIINSMTLQERRNPNVINGSRRRRIARGSGTTVQDVNSLLKQFQQVKKMMKNLGKLGRIGRPGRGAFPIPGMGKL